MILLRKFGCQIQQHRKPRVQAKVRKPGENKKTFHFSRMRRQKSPLLTEEKMEKQSGDYS